MRLSVIIPALDAPTLAETLTAVREQSRPADEIIVVGRDEAGAAAAFPEVRLIDTGRPLCAAANRNLGLAAASGDIFVFTDADCLPRPDWLAGHAERQAAGLAVVGGGVELDHLNYWARSDNISMFHDYDQYAPRGTRILLPTINLSVRRAVWEAVGDLDESFPGAAGEDSDWTIRMSQAGYPLHFEPEIVVRHQPARTRWPDVVRHWRRSGYANIRVRLRYPAVFGTPGLAASPFWLRALSPLIAARTTAGIYAAPHAWRYWSSLPVVLATKVIYCWGAARAIEEGFPLA